MARKDQQAGEPRVSKRKRMSFFKLVGIGLVLGFLAILVLLPQIATTPSILNSAIDKYAGLGPLKLEVGSASAGWFSPVSAQQVQLKDAEGNVLAKIGAVETEKSIWGWITGSTDLGTIVLSNVEAAVVAYEGTTNLEQALQPIIEQYAASDSGEVEPAVTASPLKGTIQLVDAQFILVDADRPERWQVALPKASMSLPTEEQIIGPIELSLEVSEASGVGANQSGTIAANVKQGAGDAFEVRAKVNQIPLDFWHVVHTRVPSLPVEDLKGKLSATFAGSIVSSEVWNFEITQLHAQEFAMVAPTLVGDAPARLDAISCASQCSLDGSTLRLSNTKLQCDFANASASATIPWPIPAVSASDPFIQGAALNAQGMVDLPRLVQAANSLIPLRKDMQLVSGKATFSLGQAQGEQGQAQAGAKLQLEDLKAISAGQELSWRDPLSVEVAASNGEGPLQFVAITSAEFANLNASGSLQSGRLDGSIDLSLLRKRLDQWVELPISEMEGAANVQAAWQMESGDVVNATGSLSTTPIVLATSAGKEMREAGWQGTFQGRVHMPAGTPESVQSGKLELVSAGERLVFDLRNPMHLSDAAAPPAAFSLDVHTDLARCRQRIEAWMIEPLEVELQGNVQLVANGMLDTQHVEITNANWSGQPIQVVTPDLSFSEPNVVGKFRGLVDSNDLTRTEIELLEMTSTSVSLVARDQANPDGSDSRIGRAKFLMNLSNLMNSAAATGPVGASESGAYAVTGECNGEIAWQINSAAAGINLVFNGSNVRVMHRAPDGSASLVWQEPQIASKVSGTWQAASGDINLPEMIIQAPWINYQGTMVYTVEDEQQAAQLDGQAVYDAALLSQKIVPYTGNQLQMQGQYQMPVAVQWRGNADQESVLAGLDLETRLGWEQAAVAGVVLGQADVPITVRQGLMHTAADIPVSGGFMRWDASCDLSQEQLVISQQPMTVLENVSITEEMCKGWLKYITPLLAEATRVDGQMSLHLDGARFMPLDPSQQTVAGQLTIHNASVGPGPLSNQMIGLVKQVEAIRKRDFTQMVSNTQQVWMNLPPQAIDFRMVDGRVGHENLSVTIGDATIRTSGEVGIDGGLNLIAAMPIPDDWVEKSPWLEPFRGQSLRFPVHGTLSNPKVDSRLLASLGQQAAQSAVGNVLQQGLNRGIDKLLGPAAEAEAGGDQVPTLEDAARGIGDQILGGQGLNLPGLFGGGR